MQLFSTEALTKCCGHGQEPRTAAQVSICLRLEKHTARTSNLLCLMLTADPLCSKALGSFPGNGANSCPDSSAIADTFSTIPRGWDTPGGEASILGVQRPAGQLLTPCSRQHAFLCLLQTEGLPRDHALQENSHCPQGNPNSLSTYVTSSPSTALTCLRDHNHSRKNKVKVPNTLLLPVDLPGAHVQLESRSWL